MKRDKVVGKGINLNAICINKEQVIESNGYKVIREILFCACNGLKCNGICRETNLYRKRTNGMDKCPSAYIPKPKREKKTRIVFGQDRDRDKKFRRQQNEEHTINGF
jgi:hypothetical protein